MSIIPTYPGVYIEEIPSGVRTITGVATSITAFIGRAPRGPVNEPITVNNFGDFQRTFGGLHAKHPMSFAVSDFFLNGGSQAIIVRLFRTPTRENVAVAGQAKIAVGGLALLAISQGKWGENLFATVDKTVSAEVAQDMGLTANDLFNLKVQEGQDGPSEKFVNLSVKDSPRRIDRVLAAESNLVRWDASVNTLMNASALPDVTAAGPAAATEASDSDPLELLDYVPNDGVSSKTGIYALDTADLFNLLCIPPDTQDGDTPVSVYQTALAYCEKRRAMLIVDPPSAWNRATVADTPAQNLTDLGLSGKAARNAALFFPRIKKANPLSQGQIQDFAPCGVVAGVFSRTDRERGVWKAPAGLDATLNGIAGLDLKLTDDENGTLNPLGINCLRTFPGVGRVVWGSRTLRGADLLADEYKYIPVRRLALFIEESLYRGTQWVVFEPNDEPLWSQIRLNVGTFMQDLFRKGAFQGQTPREAYFVKCDMETTPQSDINKGIVNIHVGFAPLKPAEFVMLKIQQIAGQLKA